LASIRTMDWIFLVNASSSPGLLERLKIPFDLFELKVRGSYLQVRFTYLQVGVRFTLTRIWSVPFPL